MVRFTRMYRHYLFGRKFIVHTDQQSMIWLLSFRCPQDQLARWLEELSQYHMVIHQAADIIVQMLCPACRCPLEVVAPAWIFTLATCPVADAQSVQRPMSTRMLLLRKWTLGSCPNPAVGRTTRIWGNTTRYRRLLLLAKSPQSARLRSL